MNPWHIKQYLRNNIRWFNPEQASHKAHFDHELILQSPDRESVMRLRFYISPSEMNNAIHVDVLWHTTFVSNIHNETYWLTEMTLSRTTVWINKGWSNGFCLLFDWVWCIWSVVTLIVRLYQTLWPQFWIVLLTVS